MLVALKTKIWLAVLAIVLMFTFFTLFFFPQQQGKQLMKIYNKEVQNLANFIAVGVQIGLNEQQLEAVQNFMNTLSSDPRLKSVSILQHDTSWNEARSKYKIKYTVFTTFPESETVLDATPKQNDSTIFKRALFNSSIMSGSILLAYRTKEINKSMKKIRTASLIVSGIVLILGIAIGFWLARNISVPVLALRDAANRVGEGDFTKRIEKFSNDEIGELGMAFNKMTDQLSLARKKLNETNISLSESNASLNKTLDELKSTQVQLIQSEKMASLGELTAGIAHEIQNPLNFVNNFSEVCTELLEEMKSEFEKGNKTEAEAILADLDQNLVKIIHHGKRADAIVKNMLQHSRSSSGVKEPTDISALVDEYMRLSYHGLRAKDKSFNATLETNFDTGLEKINIISQDIGRVILNIFTNAFYSVAKKKSLNADYVPIVSVSTKKTGTMAEIRIKDNGSGISQKDLDKIFLFFFTTKPTGQGTGLGLSLSYDIIKAHNGQLKVETKEGEFATFIINLPIAT